MRSRSLLPGAIIGTILSVLLCPLQLEAQTVIGRVVEPGVDTGIPAVFITLLGKDGVELPARVLSDSAGRFVLRAPLAGTYRLRAERFLIVENVPYQRALVVERRGRAGGW